MIENTGKEIMDKLSYKKTNVYEHSSSEKIKEIYDYSKGYMNFLDLGKTEREVTELAVKMATEHGFKEYKFGDKIAVGDKLFYYGLGKCPIFFTIGKDSINENGIRIIASHIDSPRLDLKQIPLYEDSGMAFFKTHYYGGIKKYQWTATPLSIHGVIIKADGEKVTVSIGENAGDPVFCINDLLPHLASRQSQEPLGSAISGESLNIVVGGLPYADEDVSDKIKLTVLSMLYDKYGITEEDFLSAEICLVPAFPARDVGFDRAFIGAYGHDDRVCAYTSLTALFDSKDSLRTSMVILADKEEIGSVGISGMQSDVVVDIIDKICEALGADSAVVRSKSKCLSADVAAAYDPNFADVYEKRNSAMLSCGTCLCKYNGSRGKSGTNDASAELVGYVRKLFADNGVIWQTAELGKVDMGGGGTVAMYIAKHNIETVDIGVPVISMHAPFELVSKADVYSTYEAFLAFLK